MNLQEAAYTTVTDLGIICGCNSSTVISLSSTNTRIFWEALLRRYRVHCTARYVLQERLETGLWFKYSSLTRRRLHRLHTWEFV